MPSSNMRDLDALSHGLVLLQEICQGYDNISYHSRALKFLARGADTHIRRYSLVQWVHGVLPTVDLIKIIESRLVPNA